MKILVDENIPLMSVAFLRKLGHEVFDIRQTQHRGIDDQQVWRLCQKGKQLLISTDRGFTSKRYNPHYGILLVILDQPNRHEIHRRIAQAILKHQVQDWPNLLVVMRDVVQSSWKKSDKVIM